MDAHTSFWRTRTTSGVIFRKWTVTCETVLLVVELLCDFHCGVGMLASPSPTTPSPEPQEFTIQIGPSGFVCLFLVFLRREWWFRLVSKVLFSRISDF